MSGQSALNFSIVGCGRMGSKYYGMFERGLIKSAHLGSVCDLDMAKMENFKCVYKTNNFEDLLKPEQPETIIISTDSSVHFEQACSAIKSGKNVVIEKPISMHKKQAEALKKLVEQESVKLFPVFQNRYNPHIQNLKLAISKDNIGQIILVSANLFWCRTQAYFDQADWRGSLSEDGGVLLNQGIHILDMLDWLFGPLKLKSAVEGSKLCDIEAPETIVCFLESESGTIINASFSLAARPHDQKTSLTMLTETGYYELGGKALNDLIVPHPLLNSASRDQKKYNESVIISLKELNFPEIYGGFHALFLNDVVSCLKDKKRQIIEVGDAIKSLALIEEIHKILRIKVDV